MIVAYKVTRVPSSTTWFGGSLKKSAAVLGISERHIYRLIEKYGLGEKNGT